MEPRKSISMFVVETYDYDKDRVFICAREPDKKIWHHFMAENLQDRPCIVRFGDRLQFHINKFKLELDRGPLLKYSIHLDEFPADLMNQIAEISPYKESPTHELHFWGLEL